MGTTALTDYMVTPTENDVVGEFSTGSGRVLQESHIAPLLMGLQGGHGCVISGFLVPVSGSAASATITAGVANIMGYRVYGDEDITIEVEDDGKTWIGLQLVRDANELVTGAQIYTNTLKTALTDGIWLGSCTASSGTITSNETLRTERRLMWGWIDIVGDAFSSAHFGSGDWTLTYNDVNNLLTVTFHEPVLQTPVVLACIGNGTQVMYLKTSDVSTTGIQWTLTDTTSKVGFVVFA